MSNAKVVGAEDQSTKVTRYSIQYSMDWGRAYMTLDLEGSWVSFVDYEKLRKELQECRQLLYDMNGGA